MYRVNQKEMHSRGRDRPGYRPLPIASKIMEEALKVSGGQPGRVWPKRELTSRLSELVTRSLVTDSASGFGVEAAPEIRAIMAQLTSVWSSPPGSEGEELLQRV